MSFGLSIRDVGKGTGLNTDHYYRIESGGVENPTSMTIHKLATFYGVEPDEMAKIVRNR